MYAFLLPGLWIFFLICGLLNLVVQEKLINLAKKIMTVKISHPAGIFFVCIMVFLCALSITSRDVGNQWCHVYLFKSYSTSKGTYCFVQRPSGNDRSMGRTGRHSLVSNLRIASCRAGAETSATGKGKETGQIG